MLLQLAVGISALAGLSILWVFVQKYATDHSGDAEDACGEEGRGGFCIGRACGDCPHHETPESESDVRINP